jgi:hypothetical protein
VWATTLIDHPLPAFRWVAVLAAALGAAAAHARWGRVPLRLAAPVLTAGLGVALSAGGLAGLFDGAAGALLCGSATALLVRWGGGEAGEAAFAAGLGSWLGLIWGGGLLVSVALAASLLGGFQQQVTLRLGIAVGVPTAASDLDRTPSSIVSLLIATWFLTGAACLLALT